MGDVDLHSVILATSSAALDDALVSLLWIASALVVSPVVVRATRGLVPDVVVLLVLGCVLGPSVLALAQVESGVELVRELGLGLLFLLAGTEIDPASLRGRQGRGAIWTWLLCLALALGVSWAFIPDATFSAAVVLALAVTSTALGTLLPILKDRDQLGGPLGTAVLTHGAVGELLPIVAMALLLSTRSTLASAGVLLAFFAVAALVAVLPHRLVLRVPGIGAALREGSTPRRRPRCGSSSGCCSPSWPPPPSSSSMSSSGRSRPDSSSARYGPRACMRWRSGSRARPTASSAPSSSSPRA